MTIKDDIQGNSRNWRDNFNEEWATEGILINRFNGFIRDLAEGKCNDVKLNRALFLADKKETSKEMTEVLDKLKTACSITSFTYSSECAYIDKLLAGSAEKAAILVGGIIFAKQTGETISSSPFLSKSYPHVAFEPDENKRKALTEKKYCDFMEILNFDSVEQLKERGKEVITLQLSNHTREELRHLGIASFAQLLVLFPNLQVLLAKNCQIDSVAFHQILEELSTRPSINSDFSNNPIDLVYDPFNNS